MNEISFELRCKNFNVHDLHSYVTPPEHQRKKDLKHFPGLFFATAQAAQHNSENHEH